MPRHLAVLFVPVVLATTVATSRPAAAYDADHTHRWIARKAIEHLRATYPGRYDDVLEHLEAFLDGVTSEDDEILDGDSDPSTLRVMRHFLRPTDGAGFTFGGKTFPSSLVWGTVPDVTNEWGYDDAIAAWQAGDRERAYAAIGHVVHLVQDATVPAHTHLDNHGPPQGDDYENYCSRQMRSDVDGDLPDAPPGSPIPEFDSLEELFQVTARISYYRNLTPGTLSDIATGVAGGRLAEMFPGIEVGWINQAWQIPGVGRLGTSFWEQEPGMFYFAELAGTGEIVRRFDASQPEAFEFAPNDLDESLAASMARDLVPIAILHSAAALKHFMDETAGLTVTPPPTRTPPVAAEDAGGCAGGGPSGAAGLLGGLAGLVIATRRRRQGAR